MISVEFDILLILTYQQFKPPKDPEGHGSILTYDTMLLSIGLSIVLCVVVLCVAKRTSRKSAFSWFGMDRGEFGGVQIPGAGGSANPMSASRPPGEGVPIGIG